MPPDDRATTGQCIAWYARHAPETVAVVEEAVPITYRRLAEDLTRCVQSLRASGVRPGMRAGIDLSRRYAQLLLMLGCELTGATAISLTADDLADAGSIARHCDLIFVSEQPKAAGLPKTFVLPVDWLSRLGPAAADPLSPEPLEQEFPADQVARIVRTSGTTGQPKAMSMTRATQHLRVLRAIERVAHDILPHPRMLCLYGLSIGSVYVRVLGVLRHGGTVVFAFGDDVAFLIATGAINYTTLSLGDAEAIARRCGPPPNGHRMHIEVFGATVIPSLRQLIRERLNAHITNKYSSNETNPIAVIDDDNVGVLCSGVEARIVDEDGRDVAPGEAGRIRVKCETMVHSYFDDPALTAACFIDGWFQTSDIGRMPAPDRLVLMGRVDDMLNIGGVKIAPAPIEARLKLIDGISDAAILSVVNENAVGRLVVAVETADPLPGSLREGIDAVLSEYKTSYEIMSRRTLPRTATGKLRRHAIEAAFRDGETAANQ